MGVFVIAEAGSCHDGNLDRARALCQAAAHAGADACKFQWWSNPEHLAARRHITGPNPYERNRMFDHWLGVLKGTCDQLGIEFMCTVYLPEDIPVVEQFVKRFKVASFEASDDDFIECHRSYDKPLIVSIGMKGHVNQRLWCDMDISLLHCVSGYPTPDDQANISAVNDSVVGGYSDHTTSLLSGALAVACGATIIEKHIRLYDTNIANPDYPHSMDPLRFKLYVEHIRQAEVLLGDGEPKIQPCEADNVKYKVVP